MEDSWCSPDVVDVVAFPHLFSIAYSFSHFESAILRVCFSLTPFVFRPPSPEIRRMRHTHEQRGTFWRLWRSVMVVGSQPPLSFEIILHSYLTVLALGTGAVSKFLLTIAVQFGRNGMTTHALQISLGERTWLLMFDRSVWEKQHDCSCSADQILPSYTSMQRSACILWRPLSVCQVIESLNFKGDTERRSITGPVDRNGKE